MVFTAFFDLTLSFHCLPLLGVHLPDTCLSLNIHCHLQRRVRPASPLCNRRRPLLRPGCGGARCSSRDSPTAGWQQRYGLHIGSSSTSFCISRLPVIVSLILTPLSSLLSPPHSSSLLSHLSSLLSPPHSSSLLILLFLLLPSSLSSSLLILLLLLSSLSRSAPAHRIPPCMPACRRS